MSRTIQILSRVLAVISLCILADHWWHFGFRGVFADFIYFYHAVLQYAFVWWAKPIAEIVAAYFKFELPEWWKDAFVLYVTMGGATVRSSSYLLSFFSKQVSEAREALDRALEQHNEDVTAWLAEHEDLEEKRRETEGSYEEEWRALFDVKNVEMNRKRDDATRAYEEAYRQWASVGWSVRVIRFVAAVLWPAVWALDLLLAQRPGRNWLVRLRTSFVGSSVYEFAKIVLGAVAVFAMNYYSPVSA